MDSLPRFLSKYVMRYLFICRRYKGLLWPVHNLNIFLKINTLLINFSDLAIVDRMFKTLFGLIFKHNLSKWIYL
jgi:hypothetical protein